MTKIVNYEKARTAAGITEVKGKVKSSKGSGMETNWPEQLDALLTQSAKV